MNYFLYGEVEVNDLIEYHKLIELIWLTNAKS